MRCWTAPLRPLSRPRQSVRMSQKPESTVNPGPPEAALTCRHCLDVPRLMQDR
jgi:hypothetical protein